MLKHIKDIRSPIAVAQQKQAARKASSETSSVKSPPLSSASPASQGPSQHQAHPSQDRSIPPKLQVDSRVNAIAPGLNTAGTSGQSGWPDVMSPALESKDRTDEFSGQGAESSKSHTTFATAISAPLNDGQESVAAPSIREIPPSTGVSYAVAIYPYMAEQEDEFDVVV